MTLLDSTLIQPRGLTAIDAPHVTSSGTTPEQLSAGQLWEQRLLGSGATGDWSKAREIKAKLDLSLLAGDPDLDAAQLMLREFRRRILQGAPLMGQLRGQGLDEAAALQEAEDWTGAMKEAMDGTGYESQRESEAITQAAVFGPGRLLDELLREPVTPAYLRNMPALPDPLSSQVARDPLSAGPQDMLPWADVSESAIDEFRLELLNAAGTRLSDSHILMPDDQGRWHRVYGTPALIHFIQRGPGTPAWPAAQIWAQLATRAGKGPRPDDLPTLRLLSLVNPERSPILQGTVTWPGN